MKMEEDKSIEKLTEQEKISILEVNSTILANQNNLLKCMINEKQLQSNLDTVLKQIMESHEKGIDEYTIDNNYTIIKKR